MTVSNIIHKMAVSPPSKWPDTEYAESGKVLIEKVYNQKPTIRKRLADILDGDSIMLPQPTTLYSQTATAQFLGVSLKTVARWIKEGRIATNNAVSKTPRILGETILKLKSKDKTFTQQTTNN